MLHPGLYEQVINNALNRELSEVPEARKSTAPIDTAEASKVLAQYLTEVVQKGFDNVQDNGGGIEAQIALANQIVSTIQTTTKEPDFAALGVDQRAEQLLALLRENDPRLATGKAAKDIERPETSLAQSSLFTGAIHEPQMYTELKKEIVSADHIDMLVSFIKWSGLRLLMDELRQFTQNGGELRIITTSYMGATDVKAIEELRQLPNTKIKVSYDTKRTRLHAKTYVFYRDTGFTTAYVGSSNLSNAAISSGLEWNVKVTRKDLPETIDALSDSPVLLGELQALLQYQYDRIDFIDEPVDVGFDCPQDLHCTYTRDQLLVALDFLKPATVREGVKWLPEKQLDVFFVTLNKADKDYSPTTMYKDYSINESLFHWQSQSTTAENSATGQRYIHHREKGSRVLLFVREFKAEARFGGAGAYTYLGTVNYVKHEGSRPMNITWKLDRPIPAKFLKKTNKLVVG